jgi:hypothetical protein
MPCLSWLVNARNRGVRGSGPPGFRRGLDATDRAQHDNRAGTGHGLTCHAPPRCITRQASPHLVKLDAACTTPQLGWRAGRGQNATIPARPAK